MRRRRSRGGQRGQSLVELVALLPLLVLVGLIGWQLAVAGFAWTLAGGAARAGARAAEVGAPAADAVRASLPPRYAAGAVTLDAPGAAVRVRVPVPPVLPFMPRLEVAAAVSGERP
jgi:hypothetical protein